MAVVTRGGRFEAAALFTTFAELLEAMNDSQVIAVDIPIGMPAEGRRLADTAAKKFVGLRASSVFFTPPRVVMEAPDYAEARAISWARFGQGVSSQSYRGLRQKLLSVDRLVRPGSPVFEVHPEVSFRAMAGRPLAHNKRSWNGQAMRRRLLRGEGIELPEDLDAAGVVPVDDMLDAAAAAWSARRIARGEAVSLPEPPEVDELGRDMAIWY